MSRGFFYELISKFEQPDTICITAYYNEILIGLVQAMPYFLGIKSNKNHVLAKSFVHEALSQRWHLCHLAR